MAKYTVIGGGILGASAAYHLAVKGEKVTLIDREDEGQATDAAAGIICPWLSQRRNKAWYKLVKEGAAFYPSLIEELEQQGEAETGYYKSGALALHNDDKIIDEKIQRAVKRREDAPEIGVITKVDSSESVKMFPPLKEGFSGVHVSGGARVNGSAVRKALINCARKCGAEIIKGAAYLEKSGNGEACVYVNGELVHSDVVIVAAGAWAAELFLPLGLKLNVRPQRGQIIHLKMENTDNSDWPVVIPRGDYYLLNFGKGQIVAGATREDDTGFEYKKTVSGINEILTDVLHTAPGLKDAEIVEMRTGFRPFTPGSLPVIGNVPGFSNIFMANGLGATGLTCGPYLGYILSALASGNSIGLDLTPYDLSRVFE